MTSLPVYLINLDRSPDRLAQMRARLEALDLPYTRVPGVDGRAHWEDLQADLDIPRFERNVGRRVMAGEIGCYASHMAVWDRMIADDAPMALILEDDVVFHDDFCAALKAAQAAADHWDLLKLNVIRAKQPVRKARAGAWDLNAYIGPFTGMGAYMIKRDVAAQLRHAIWPPTRPIDHELDRVFMHHIRHLGMEPFPSHVEDGGRSTITGASFDGVKKFKGFKRLPLHFLRLGNTMRKLGYVLR